MLKRQALRSSSARSKTLRTLLSLLFLASCSFLVSCGSSPQPRARLENPKVTEEPEFELISRQESVSQELLLSPTSFSLAPSSDHAARTKLLLFYSQYLGDKEPVVEWRGEREYLEAQSKNYAYRVTRDLRGANGVDYQIECIRKNLATGSDSSSRNNFAKLNAKNLSRFLREGQLELLALRK